MCDCLEHGSRLKPTGRFGHLVTFNESREQTVASSSSSSDGARMKERPTYGRPLKSQPSQTISTPSPSASEKGRAGRPRKCSTPIVEHGGNCNLDCSGSSDLNGQDVSQEIRNEQILYSASPNVPTNSPGTGCASSRRNTDNERKRKRNSDSDSDDKPEVATIKRRERKIDDDNDGRSNVHITDLSSDDGENTFCAPAVPAVGRVGSWAEL